jgi:urease accessory protein
VDLRLLQLADSALPIGGYSHSWGLEAAIDRGLVGDALSLERWVRSWLCYTIAPAEGVVVAAVCRAAGGDDWPLVFQANELLAASLVPPTLRHASRDMGGQLLALAAVWPWAEKTVAALRLLQTDPAGEWHHAAVFGTLCAAAGADPVDALVVYLHQAALGCIGAGVRAVPVGHTHGQQILARLHADMQTLARRHAEQDLETAGSFAPAYEALCHAQGRLYTRLFRS